MTRFPGSSAALALSLLVSAPAAAEAPAVVVQIWSFGFAPNPVHLTAGKPVILTFINRSGSSHDFKAPDFFEQSEIVAGRAHGDEVDLRPHETRTITLVPRAGTYHVHCSHFLHEQMGMSDEIIVD